MYIRRKSVKNLMYSLIVKSRSLNSAGCTTMKNVLTLNVAMLIDYGLRLISDTK